MSEEIDSTTTNHSTASVAPSEVIGAVEINDRVNNITVDETSSTATNPSKRKLSDDDENVGNGSPDPMKKQRMVETTENNEAASTSGLQSEHNTAPSLATDSQPEVSIKREIKAEPLDEENVAGSVGQSTSTVKHIVKCEPKESKENITKEEATSSVRDSCQYGIRCYSLGCFNKIQTNLFFEFLKANPYSKEFTIGTKKNPLYIRTWDELSTNLNSVGPPQYNIKQWQNIWKQHVDFANPNSMLKRNPHEFDESVICVDDNSNLKRKRSSEESEKCQCPRTKVVKLIQNESQDTVLPQSLLSNVNTTDQQINSKRVRTIKKNSQNLEKSTSNIVEMLAGYVGANNIPSNIAGEINKKHDQTFKSQNLTTRHLRSTSEFSISEQRRMSQRSATPRKSVGDIGTDQSITKATQNSDSEADVRKRLLQCMLKLFKKSEIGKVNPENPMLNSVEPNKDDIEKDRQINKETIEVKLKESTYVRATTQLDLHNSQISFPERAPPTIDEQYLGDRLGSKSIDSGVEDDSGFYEASKTTGTQTDHAGDNDNLMNSSSCTKCQKDILLRKLTAENEILKRKIRLMKKNGDKLHRHWERKSRLYEKKVKALELMLQERRNTLDVKWNNLQLKFFQQFLSAYPQFKRGLLKSKYRDGDHESLSKILYTHLNQLGPPKRSFSYWKNIWRQYLWSRFNRFNNGRIGNKKSKKRKFRRKNKAASMAPFLGTSSLQYDLINSTQYEDVKIDLTMDEPPLMYDTKKIERASIEISDVKSTVKIDLTMDESSLMCNTIKIESASIEISDGKSTIIIDSDDSDDDVEYIGTIEEKYWYWRT